MNEIYSAIPQISKAVTLLISSSLGLTGMSIFGNIFPLWQFIAALLAKQSSLYDFTLCLLIIKFANLAIKNDWV